MSPHPRTARTARAALSLAVVAVSLTALSTVSAPPATAMVPPGVFGTATAPMGWNSWYFFNNNYDSQNIADEAASLATPNADLPLNGSGGHESMADLGYKNVGMDGGWWTNGSAGRDANGNIVPNSTFLSGYRTKSLTLSNGTTVPSVTLNSMSDLTGYIHSLGLNAGIYTDTGTTGCGGQNGSGGHEAADVTTFATWGFDWAKVDHCGGVPSAYGSTMADYEAWGSLMAGARTTGGLSHPMALEICEWGQGAPDNPSVWGGAAGRTWRTGRDISFANGYGTPSNGGSSWINFGNVQNNFSLNDHPSNEAAGQYNDPDYLLIGPGFGDNPTTGQQQSNGGTLYGLTPDEQQSYFGMWAVQGAPLVLSTDVANLTPAIAGIIGNPAVIGVDQDSADHQGQKVLTNGAVQVWSKQLAASGSRAVLLLNTGTSATTYSFTTQGLDLLGSPSVQNLYSGVGLGTLSQTGSLSFTLAAHQSVMLKLTGGTEQQPETVFAADASGLNQENWNGSSWSAWQSLSLGVAGSTGPGSMQGDPAVVSLPSGTDVFVRGGDNALWEDSYTNGAWGAWVSLGGTLSASPAAASLGQDRIDVFVRGTDGALWQKTYQQVPASGSANSPDVAWTPNWTDLGGPNTTTGPGTFTGTPAAVASLNRVDVFVRGNDDALWQKSYISGAWTDWTSLGGTLTSSPTAASAGPGQIDVFAARTGGTVGELNWTAGGGWTSGWTSLGSQVITGAPSAAEVAGRANVYARGTDNSLWQWYRVGAGPSGTWQKLDSTQALTSSPAASGHV
ncbi:alpha-galactosidase [Kitasatospora sp. MAP5-34]|nr:alpha-galactosidase [Kitasatospora sp. MAP5-34]